MNPGPTHSSFPSAPAMSRSLRTSDSILLSSAAFIAPSAACHASAAMGVAAAARCVAPSTAHSATSDASVVESYHVHRVIRRPRRRVALTSSPRPTCSPSHPTTRARAAAPSRDASAARRASSDSLTGSSGRHFASTAARADASHSALPNLRFTVDGWNSTDAW